MEIIDAMKQNEKIRNDKTITIRLDHEMLNKLMARSRMNGTTVSETIRSILSVVLDTEQYNDRFEEIENAITVDQMADEYNELLISVIEKSVELSKAVQKIVNKTSDEDDVNED